MATIGKLRMDLTGSLMIRASGHADHRRGKMIFSIDKRIFIYFWVRLSNKKERCNERRTRFDVERKGCNGIQ